MTGEPQRNRTAGHLRGDGAESLNRMAFLKTSVVDQAFAGWTPSSLRAVDTLRRAGELDGRDWS